MKQLQPGRLFDDCRWKRPGIEAIHRSALPRASAQPALSQALGFEARPQVDQWIATALSVAIIRSDKDGMGAKHLVIIQNAFERAKCVRQ